MYSVGEELVTLHASELYMPGSAHGEQPEGHGGVELEAGDQCRDLHSPPEHLVTLVRSW